MKTAEEAEDAEEIKGMRDVLSGRASSHDSYSFARWGLSRVCLVPTAYAVGFILTPLRG